MARPRGRSWQADARKFGGKRLNFATQAEAEAYERAFETGNSSVSAVTLGAFIDEHFDYLWGDAKSPETPKRNLAYLRRHFGDDTLLTEITSQNIQTLVSKMKSEGLANGTINRKLSALSKPLKLADVLEVIPKMPHLPYRKEAKGRDRVLSSEEELKTRQFFNHIGLPLSAALTDFLTYTGCRTGEAYKLSRENVSDGRASFLDTKNGSDRTITLPKRAAEAWKVALSASDRDRPWMEVPKGTFTGHWGRLREHLGTTNDPCFVPHMLRHTCATRLVVAGVPLAKVMEWMGHKNIQTTMRYAHLAPGDLDDCVRALEE